MKGGHQASELVRKAVLFFLSLTKTIGGEMAEQNSNAAVTQLQTHRLTELTVFTNKARVDRQRVGVGKHNKPEARAKLILQQIQESFSETKIFFSSRTLDDETWLNKIHSQEYLEFLEKAFENFAVSKDVDWTDESGGLIPNHFYRKPPSNKVPIYKKSGYFGSDMMTPLFEDSYRNALLAASQAYRAAEYVINNKDIVFALTYSPGHHAKFDQYGGYCFINNAAVAAYRIRELSNKSVGILDLDYHQGSTTIIEEMTQQEKVNGKIYAVSIHGNPANEYPSFEGYDDETTELTENIPLPGGTTWEKYDDALQYAGEFLNHRKISALVIAFGADTYFDDPDVTPANRFALKEDDYIQMGSKVRKLFADLPILVTQEGGYNMEKVGILVCNFLRGLVG